MSTIEPGWYKDPAEPTTQRYWDGEGWLGDPISADATPPAGPPPTAAPVPPTAVASTATAAPTSAPPTTSAAPSPAPPALPWPGGRYPEPGPTPGAGSGPSSAPPGWPGFGPIAVLVEPRPHGLRLAGGGSRFVARLVDIFAVLVLCVIANAWFAIEFWRGFEPYLRAVYSRSLTGPIDTESMPVPPESIVLLPLLMSIVATAVWFAYEVPATANSGQTLGKRLLGVKVVRLESEDQLGFGRAFRRWGRLGLPTLFWGSCYGLPILLQLFDCLFVAIDRPLRQALHDKAAATVVIDVPRPGRPDTARMPTSPTTGGRHVDSR